MAVTFGFYNRNPLTDAESEYKYDAVQLSSIFDGLVGDGVFASIGDVFVVSATTGMDITVGTGRAWFNHTWTLNDALLPLTVSTADVLQDRIDAVVLEINTSTRTNSIKIVVGTGSSTDPVPPTMVKDYANGIFQYPLAYIRVNRQVTAITQANITNKVGTEDCPFVTGVVQVTSLDALLGQWQAELNDFVSNEEGIIVDWFDDKQDDFDAWFQNLQDQLDDEQATHLQNQIDALQLSKQNTLTFDSTPTPNSSNPVTSDGIAAAIANAVDFRISMGTGAPSGGSDGDIYFQYNA